MSENISDKLANKPQMDHSDDAIKYNATLQAFIAFGMLLLYLAFRTRAPWLYFPNVSSKPDHPCYKHTYKKDENDIQKPTGFLSFIYPIFTIEDTKLLGMIGFDGFMLLQTIKLLYRIFLILGIFLCPTLCFYNYKSSKENTTFFEKITISDGAISSLNQIILITIVFLVSIFIFYLVFIYYKRYVTLRQMYLVSPAALTSVLTLKKIQSMIGSDDNTAIEFINVISNTVIFNRLPSYIKNDKDVNDYIRKLGIGKVIDAVLIKDTYKIQKLYEKRDDILQNIEKEINKGFNLITQKYNIEEESGKSSFKDVYEAYKTKTDEDYEEYSEKMPDRIRMSAKFVFRHMKFQIDEKVKIFTCFVNSCSNENNIHYSPELPVFLEELRDTNERILKEKEILDESENSSIGITIPMSDVENVQDKVNHKSLVKDINDKSLVKDINDKSLVKDINDKSLAEIVKNESVKDNSEEVENSISKIGKFYGIPSNFESTVFVKSNISEDVSFFSMSQIYNFKNSKRLFTLDLPINRKRAFVTFSDYKEAGIVKQSQIGTRVFSLAAITAPAPNDIIWKNINQGEVFCFFTKLCSNALFLLFNIAFYILVSQVVSMLGLVDENSNNLILKWIPQKEKFKKWFEGILTPLVYNILIFFVPTCLTVLINLEGIHAFSLFQIRMMYLYSMFLFYNAFLAFFLSVDFFRTIYMLISGDETWKAILSKFGTNIIQSSVFFFNTIVQRMCVGTMMTVLKPSPFIQNFILSPFLTKTRRQEAEYRFSPPVDFGCIVPNVLLVFPMALSYSIISPPLIILGFLFYFINYYVYKNELIYMSRNPYESGGVFWTASSQFIVLAVGAFQFTSMACIYSKVQNSYAAGILILLLIMDYYYLSSIKNLFKGCTESYPLNEPEEEFLDDFSSAVLIERKSLLEQFREKDEECDEDKMPISEIGLKDKDIVTNNNSYYKDPSAASNISDIILPKDFYIIIHFIRTFDTENLFGFK